MKIFIALQSAVFRSVKIWKGILIVWISSLLLAGMVALPLKAALKSGFGDSMITEKIADGINPDVLLDSGISLKMILSYFSAAIVISVLITLIINSFLAGGLFNALKESTGKFTAREFFGAAGKYFWSFLVVSLVTSLISIFLLILVVIVPVSIITASESAAEGSSIKFLIILGSLFLLLISIIILVADYARAWQVSNEKNAGFRAIGFGFRQTFRTFFSSLPLMLILLTIQFLFGWLVLSILPGLKPVTGGGVFQLFLLSQFLFIIKILLKTWRYGSVTSLMEQNLNPVTDVSAQQEPEYQHHTDLI